MDLGDELVRGDIFYDFVVPKLETGSIGSITPVGFIDSVDYITSVIDPNNNNNGSQPPQTGSPLQLLPSQGNGNGSNPLKLFIDEMLFSTDEQNTTNPILEDELNSNPNLLNGFTWSSSDGSNTNTTLSSPCPEEKDNQSQWLSLSQGDGTPIATLTNILDPIFVTYQDEDDDRKIQLKYYSNEVSSTHNSNTILYSPELQQEKEEDGTNCHYTIFTQDNSILLRSALEGNHNLNSNQLKSEIKIGSESNCNSMIELRRVLSYPPITTNPQEPTSPTSTSHNNNQSQYYEFRILHNNEFIQEDEIHLPNVQELIMNRIDGNNDTKINSTTSKWTFPTTIHNTQNKIIRRRKKISKEGGRGGGRNEDSQNSSDIGYMNNNSPINTQNPNNSNNISTCVNVGHRRERSLHYCNICNKGFKDKYSVTVHIRTHTGEKPFSCSLCGKNFRQKAHLAKHYQTHAAKAHTQTHTQGGLITKGSGIRKQNLQTS